MYRADGKLVCTYKCRTKWEKEHPRKEHNTMRKWGGWVPNSSKITKVRSIRASFDFWELVEKIAKKENTDPNKLIIKATKEYCKEVNNGTNNWLQ